MGQDTLRFLPILCAVDEWPRARRASIASWGRQAAGEREMLRERARNAQPEVEMEAGAEAEAAIAGVMGVAKRWRACGG